LIDLTRIRELNYIKTQKKLIKIGALVTHADVVNSKTLRIKAPLLVEACESIGSPQVRNMGTIVGNIMNASPAADTAVALMALDAEAIIASRTEKRVEKIESIFVGPGKTSVKGNELVIGIRFQQIDSDQGGGFFKLGKRNSLAISIVNSAAVIKIDKSKKIFTDAKIAIGAVAPTPLRAKKAEEMLIGSNISNKNIENAAQAAMKEAFPISDIRSSAEYRKEMIKIAVKQVISKALEAIK